MLLSYRLEEEAFIHPPSNLVTDAVILPHETRQVHIIIRSPICCTTDEMDCDVGVCVCHCRCCHMFWIYVQSTGSAHRQLTDSMYSECSTIHQY